MVTRAEDTAADAAGDFTRGQQDYWRGMTMLVALQEGGAYLSGWGAAAAEANDVLRAHGHVVRGLPTLNRALDAAGAAVSSLAPVKITPRQRLLKADAEAAIAEARTLLDLDVVRDADP